MHPRVLAFSPQQDGRSGATIPGDMHDVRSSKSPPETTVTAARGVEGNALTSAAGIRRLISAAHGANQPARRQRIRKVRLALRQVGAIGLLLHDVRGR